jgi:hypothetical protein
MVPLDPLGMVKCVIVVERSKVEGLRPDGGVGNHWR